ncbi:hypothetical protein G6011_00370 [Alternaria panax]|uniref:Uncharacterized protein n=1 Tax=Alternaria panax TaxID=48097 RepID=A0AAD4NVP8_9PLEO|nr:hypothetical protein G6011_00370 [Alternaria panax]
MAIWETNKYPFDAPETGRLGYSDPVEPEDTHFEPGQPKGSDLEKAVYDRVRELGLHIEDPLEGLRKVFHALKKEMKSLQTSRTGLYLPGSLVKGINFLPVGNLLYEEWAPLWDGFQKFYPQYLPGSILRVEMEKKSGNRRIAPTQTNAMRKAANKGAGSAKPPLTPAEQDWGDWLDSLALSLGPEDYTFPENCKRAHRRMNQMTAKEWDEVTLQYREKSPKRTLGSGHW